MPRSISGGIRPSLRDGRQQHVFQNRTLRQQVMILKHEADLPIAKIGQPRLVQSKRILPAECNLPTCRAQQRADDMQQSALSRTAGAKDRQILAAR